MYSKTFIPFLNPVKKNKKRVSSDSVQETLQKPNMTRAKEYVRMSASIKEQILLCRFFF